MKASTIPAPQITRKAAVVGWFTIITQAALPLSFAYTPLVQAATKDAEQKWYQTGNTNPATVFDNNNAANMSQRETGGDATGMARSAATGALTSSVEEWLSQFGTARVQLNLDDKFKTSGSEADLLVPLYDDKSTILFTQLGFRHKDDRSTGNLGLGARHFVDDWMLGVNTFYDNDFTGDNRRLGLGVEAWRDYLKLSGNSYLRLSNWHQSRDFRDYDERPANGYDLRAEGWLPAYPQLGAKLMYEQYFGDEVALFGKDNRQSNPWAFTGGITYTPVPLLTVGAQHRAGKDGQNDSQISLQVNYRLGESWGKQLDPGQVGASRTLAGTRYDLVERNNTIVLEYRKQETVKLILPEKTTGKSRSVVPLTFQVQTKHPLQRVDWEATSLVAAGGTIAQAGTNQLLITLPPFQAGGSNVHRIAGVAYDTQGNTGSATAEIHVQTGDVSVGHSTVSVSPDTLPADGKSTALLTINLVDADGNPVPGMAKSLTSTVQETLTPVTFSLKSIRKLVTAPQSATVSAVEETSPGVYQATVTAGTRVGTVTVSSMFNDVALPDIVITELADVDSARIAGGAIAVTTDGSVADSTTANMVEATVTDAGGNKLPGAKVTFSLTGSAAVAPGSSLTTTADEKGVASVAFVNTKAETVTVTATLESGNAASVDAHFVADSKTATLSSGDVAVNKNTVIANGSDPAIFTATVKDAHGNPVPNMTLNWGTNKGTLTGTGNTTDSSGVMSVELRHTVAEAVQVTASVGSAGSIDAPLVTFVADADKPDATQSTLAVSAPTLVAGKEDATVTLTLKDANGNAILLPAGEITFTSTGSGTFEPVNSHGDGTYTAVFKGTKAGVENITPQVKGNTFGMSAVSVTVTADNDSPSATRSALAASPASITAGTGVSALTLSLKDENDNAIIIPAGDITFVSTGSGTITAVTSHGDGTYTAEFRGTKTGVEEITPQMKGNAFGMTPVRVTLTADKDNLSATYSTLTVSQASIVADKEASTVTLTLKDGNDNAITDGDVSFSSSSGNGTFTALTSHGDGTYTAVFQSTIAGVEDITPLVKGSGFGMTPVSVTVTADSSTAAIGSGDVKALDDSILANGIATARLEAIIKDAHGNPVQGADVTWSTDGHGSFSAVTKTDATGKATAELSGTLAGIEQVSASVNGKPAVNADKTIELKANEGTAKVTGSDIAVDNLSAKANNVGKITFDALVRDEKGNPVPGVDVTWATDKGTLSGSTSQTDANGVATIILSSDKIGPAQVTVKVKSNPLVNAPEVTFTADKDSAGIDSRDLSVSDTQLVANGRDTVTYTAIVRDGSGNKVSGLDVAWQTDLGNLSGATSTTGANGEATITLKGTQVGDAEVTATINGKDTKAQKVTFIADKATATLATGAVTRDEDSIVTNNTDVSRHTALVTDANGNPVPGVDVSWTTTPGSTVSPPTSKTGPDGKATTELKGTKTGDAVVTATVRGTEKLSADKVTLIADALTAKVVTLTSSIGKITGNGAENAVQTAIVKDANDNLVEGVEVSWSTSKGQMTESTSKTDSNGEAIGTLHVVETGPSNVKATVTAAAVKGSQTTDVEVRTVIKSSSGLYVWTMIVDHNTDVLDNAKKYCAIYGNGRVMSEADFDGLIREKVDFKEKSTGGGEYTDKYYKFSDQWGVRSGDIRTEDSTPWGKKENTAGSGYICIK